MESLPHAYLERRGDDLRLHLSGNWVARETGVRSETEVQHLLQEVGNNTLRFDTAEIGRWDSALVLFVQALKSMNDSKPKTEQASLIFSDLPEAVCNLLSLAATDKGPVKTTIGDVEPSVFTCIGRSFFKFCHTFFDVTTTIGETVLHGFSFLRGKAQTRTTDILELIKETGADALGIVSIVNFLVGAILAFVGAVQLKRFGAGIYVTDLVGIAVVREMAAIMTAIVMAGRTGAAFAAHLATMQGNEEIDALKVFGISVCDFLVLPRVIALVLMMPLLYLYACAVGIFGGFVVSVATLDLTPTLFMTQLQGAIAGKQFFIGLTKSVAFGALVALAGCHIGLKAGRSAADVGCAATSSVVAGIVGIIALDALFAVCANALGI